MKEEIVEYIRANRDTYTQQAVNKALLDTGYSPEEIAAAWQEIEKEEAPSSTPPPPARPVGRQRTGGLVATWILLLLVGVVLVLLTNLGLSFSYVPPESQGVKEAAIVAVNLGSLIVGIALLIATVRLLRRDWPVGRVTGLVFAVAFIWYMIVLGTCVYTPQVLR